MNQTLNRPAMANLLSGREKPFRRYRLLSLNTHADGGHDNKHTSLPAE